MRVGLVKLSKVICFEGTMKVPSLESDEATEIMMTVTIPMTVMLNLFGNDR